MPYGLPVNLSFRLPVALCVASFVFTPLLAVENALAARAEVAAGADVIDEPAASAEAPVAQPDHANPYRRLTLRNAFAIKPPPPPAPVLPPPAVTNPPVTLPIFVTGFSLLKGVKKVYLVVNRPGSKSPDYVTASEGEEFEGFQVIEINPRQESVRVLNAGNEVTLNFKDNGMKSVAGGAGTVPGGPSSIPAPRPSAGVGAAGAGPTIIGRGAGSAGVTGSGANFAPEPVEVRGRGSVITGGAAMDATAPAGITPVQSGYVVPAGGFQNQPVPVPRTRPAPPPPPLPGL
jgi:hypothetical protein